MVKKKSKKQSKAKKVSVRRKQAAMKITARRRQVIRQLAQDMGELVPATAYGKGFCFESLAKDLNLSKYWTRKRNKVESIAHFLEQIFRYKPRMPFKIAREVVSRGVERGKKNSRLVTRELLNSIGNNLKELDCDMLAELKKVELDHPTVQYVIPPKETVQLLKRMSLHVSIQKDCVTMFENGHMNEAVRKALERFEKYIQDRINDHKSTGQGLMSKAFNEQQPLIALNDMKTANDQSEQLGFKLLAMGAMSGMRNLYSHGDIPEIHPIDALERLAFVSLLFKRIDVTIE